MKIVVGLEEPAILFLFIRLADLVADEPAHATEQAGFTLVEGNSLPEKLDSLHHPRVAIVVVIKLNRNIVGEVMGLKIPDGVKVGL